MLGFIIPVKSKARTNDWPRYCRIVERTLRSACAQTHSGFRVFLACHEMPEVRFHHPSLEFVPVAWGPPSEEVEARRKDKHSKLRVGFARARRHGVTHIMALDSDDLVSSRLAALVSAQSDSAGWYFRSGYAYKEGNPLLYRIARRFHMWCGSSHILRRDLVVADERNGCVWRLDHRRISHSYAMRQVRLEPVPFPGAVYCVSHGENLNDYTQHFWPTHGFHRAFRRLLFQRAATPALVREFGLYALEAQRWVAPS